MITMGRGSVKTCSGLTRRDFLRVGGVGLGALGLSLPDRDVVASGNGTDGRAVILLMLVGGPSQLETWDPKPEAPAEIRGPFRSIATRVPGIRICENLPRLADRMDRLALVRSVYHDEAPIHETGQQLLQTGQLCRLDKEHPHIGSVVAHRYGAPNQIPPFMMVPGPIVNTGVQVPHGQSAGWLGDTYNPFHLADDPGSPGFDPRKALERARRFVDQIGLPNPMKAAPAATLWSDAACNAFDLTGERTELRDAYGRNTFGQCCLLARRLVQSGVRLVTVNMFDTVFNQVTWDCHGSAPFSTLEDYSRSLLPTLDQAVSALLDDLAARGLLESTLVVATGEFGRTPKLNAAGGRDHWPGVWSALLAGGGIRGGQVIGASDSHASAPADRPVTPQELLATMYFSLGMAGEGVSLASDAKPIVELLA